MNVGDRVIYTNSHVGSTGPSSGSIGTVKGLTNNLSVAVEFDKPFNGAHSCGGRTETDRGWLAYRLSLKTLPSTIIDEEL